MKNLESDLLGLYTAIITDVCRYYPEDAPAWRRTHVHLRAIMEARGSKFFTIDLVASGKHFDRCLSDGLFTRSGLPHQRPRKSRWVVPRLFEALLTRIFHENGVLRQDVDKTAVFLTRQLYYAAKKVRMNCDPSATFSAVEEFVDIEEVTRIPNLDWGCDDLGISCVVEHHLRDALHTDMPSSVDQPPLDFGSDPIIKDGCPMPFSALLVLCQQVADLISTDIGEITYDAVLPKHGPHAVSDLRVGESKYSFPHWPKKLERTFPAIGFAFANEGLWSGLEDDPWVPQLGAHEPPSKLIAVPKTQKAPRLICSEPTAHQWMQQGVKAALLAGLKRSFLTRSIDFFDQTKSGKSALSASALGSGCTIDLSSASDRLSCWLVERFFRRNKSALEAFHAVRTRWVVNNVDKKSPKYLVLRKFTTQGSALTFPIQSIVFAGISLACTMFANGIRPAHSRASWRTLRKDCWEYARTVRVFGDDIIVPENAGFWVTECLSTLGLKVNTSKSFVGGKFYESCGVEAYDGVNVTPIYVLEFPVESKPGSIVSAVDSSNNLHKAGLWATASWLFERIPNRFRKRIGIFPIDSGVFGLKSFVGTDISHLKEIWNEDYQRWELSSFQPLSRQKKDPDRALSSVFQYFTERPSPQVYWSAGIPRKEKAIAGTGLSYCGDLSPQLEDPFRRINSLRKGYDSHRQRYAA
jgi:hypothetical protein